MPQPKTSKGLFRELCTYVFKKPNFFTRKHSCPIDHVFVISRHARKQKPTSLIRMYTADVYWVHAAWEYCLSAPASRSKFVTPGSLLWDYEHPPPLGGVCAQLKWAVPSVQSESSSESQLYCSVYVSETGNAYRCERYERENALSPSHLWTKVWPLGGKKSDLTESHQYWSLERSGQAKANPSS